MKIGAFLAEFVVFDVSRSRSKKEAFGHQEKLSRPKISQFTL
jgi:hypothetical protein